LPSAGETAEPRGGNTGDLLHQYRLARTGGPGTVGRTVCLKGEKTKGRVTLPDDGPPQGPPIGGAPGGGPGVIEMIGKRKAALVALAGVIAGALASLIPRFLI